MAKGERRTGGMYDNSESGQNSDGNTSGEGQAMKLDPGYARIVNKITSSISDEKSRRAVGTLLVQEGVRKTYDILKQDDVSDSTIYNIMSNENTLRNLQKHGGKITVADYLEGIAHSLRRNEHYGEVIEDMREQGVISDGLYRQLEKSVGEDNKRNVRNASRLEQVTRAAVWLFVAIGAIIMFVSGASMTGAVVGAGSLPQYSILFIIGFALFIIGLILNFRNY